MHRGMRQRWDRVMTTFASVSDGCCVVALSEDLLSMGSIPPPFVRVWNCGLPNKAASQSHRDATLDGARLLATMATVAAFSKG